MGRRGQAGRPRAEIACDRGNDVRNRHDGKSAGRAMMIKKPTFASCLFTLLLAALVVFPVGRSAAQYPERPIRLILPFPPGGAVDHVARLVTARMAEEFGRPFVIENKAGA